MTNSIDRSSEVDAAELRNDQKYVYTICIAIISGKCDYLSFDLGTMDHYTWLTTVSRILRLHISTPNLYYQL